MSILSTQMVLRNFDANLQLFINCVVFYELFFGGGGKGGEEEKLVGWLGFFFPLKARLRSHVALTCANYFLTDRNVILGSSFQTNLKIIPKCL